MADTKEQIIELVSSLSVLELADLVKALEEKFGVTAAAPMMMGGMMPMGAAPAEAAADEGPTSFDVVLADVGAQKIQVIKVVRELTGLGLKEAKDLVDGAPKPVKEDLSEDEAKDVQSKLEAVGAKIELKGK